MFVRSTCLTEICINVVVSNLEFFVTNEKIPEKNVNFLLRCYGIKVFHEYRKMKKVIKEEVLLWFLSPHVKEITLPRKLFSERIVDKLQSVGMVITSLNLHRSAAPEDVLNAIIRCVPCVKNLDLSYTSCTDNTLSVIQQTCAELENLNLSCCENITADGLKNICGKIRSLKILDLTDSGVECYRASMTFNKMRFLECIKLDGFTSVLVEMHSFGLRQKFKKLTELMYDGMAENDTEAIQILTKLCPNIKKLHFDFPVEKKVLKACTGFKELEELKFKVSHRSDHDVRMSNFLAPILPISSNLKTLILSCLQIPTVMLIENFRNLEKLYLKNVSFTSFKKEDITCTENKLDVLVIKSTDMEVSSTTYQAINLLISLSKHVTKLDLSHNQEFPSDLFDVILDSMKHLSSVNFSYTFVKMSSLIPFFDIPSLKKIAANCFEDTESFAKQKLLPKLSSTLSWCRVYDEDSDGESPDINDGCDSDDSYDSDTTDDSLDDDVISNGCLSDRSTSTPDRYYYFPDAFDDSEMVAFGYFGALAAKYGDF